ncbi:MAG TPA: hypothetical protein VGB85_28025, partial [Nannocystis sp.]
MNEDARGHVRRDRSFGTFAVALGVAALVTASCGGEDRRVAVYPEDSSGARLNLSPAMIKQITLPDNFVLRPDEFA